MEESVARRLLSDARLQKYLDIADGDWTLAIDLYRWNVELSASFFELLAYLEVGVRNSCHAVLTAAQPAETGIPWYLDRAVLQPGGLRAVQSARDRVYDEHGAESPGQVVASLSFGFWRGLLDRKNEELWIRSLHKAFPDGDGKRRTVGTALGELHPFRNRLAHHQPIFHYHPNALDRRRGDITIVASALSADFAAWIDELDRTAAVRSVQPSFS